MITLEVISPEGVLTSEKVESVTLPGAMGSFTVLTGHAPITSSLVAGRVVWPGGSLEIAGGVAHVADNVVKVLV